jgi:hypothetical protein
VPWLNQAEGNMIPTTRAPIRWVKNNGNWFFLKFAPSPNQEDFGALLNALQEGPPDLWQDHGFIGLVPFDWGYRGVIKGGWIPSLADCRPSWMSSLPSMFSMTLRKN